MLLKIAFAAIQSMKDLSCCTNSALAGVVCRGHRLVKATVFAKPLNFATNIASLVVFIATGHVVWAVGMIMILGH